MKPTAVVCVYAPVGTAALDGLLAGGVNVLALYTYPQGRDEAWFEAPEALAGMYSLPWP